jgi:hypothetical protein
MTVDELIKQTLELENKFPNLSGLEDAAIWERGVVREKLAHLAPILARCLEVAMKALNSVPERRCSRCEEVAMRMVMNKLEVEPCFAHKASRKISRIVSNGVKGDGGA